LIQNLYSERGQLNNFVNWSQPSQPPRAQCASLNGGGTFSAIGPFSSALNATKLIQFAAAQGVRRAVVKIGVGISDGQNNSSTIVSTIPFLTLEARDLLRNNSLLASASTGYNAQSPIQTQCGFTYQFLFILTAPAGSVLEQVMLSFALSPTISTLWWLFDFTVEAGCSGFTVGTACDSCLSSTYPLLTFEGAPDGCHLCDIACATCGTGGACLSCESYAVKDATTGKCAFPSSYSIYNQSSQFQVTAGSAVAASSVFFGRVYQSQARQLGLAFTLKNAQGYLLKMTVLYPGSYADSSANLTITIDNTTTTISSLNKIRATLSAINAGAAQLFMREVVIDRMTATVLAAGEVLVAAVGSLTD
jgi:hypothetical protein